MILLMCVDDGWGLAFNGRRQSRDRQVTADMLRLAGESRLWMAPGSLKLFQGPEGQCPGQVQAAEDFLERAGEGEYSFAETLDTADESLEERVEELVLYRWNRKYPADVRLQWDFEKYKLKECVEFPGYSHEKITRERYVKGRKE